MARAGQQWGDTHKGAMSAAGAAVMVQWKEVVGALSPEEELLGERERKR